MIVWFETVMQGAMLGGLYALFGVGLVLGFGIMRVVNIAHGDFVILAAYLGLVFTEFFGINPLLTVIPVLLVMFGVGYALQRGVLNRVLGADPLPPLMITFGLSVIIQNLLVEVFGANLRGLDSGQAELASVPIGPIQLGVLPLAILGLTVVLFLAMQWVISRTRVGRIVRATADDQEISQLMGVDNKGVYSVVLGCSLGLAALAGILLAVQQAFSPFSGVERLLIAFEVVIIGGVGSIWGALVGGISLGIVQLLGLRWDPDGGLLYAHLFFFVVLMLKPEGLASWKRQRSEK